MAAVVPIDHDGESEFDINASATRSASASRG
jgi:hypothetical protein